MAVVEQETTELVVVESSVLAAQSRAEIDSQIATAHAYPRRVDRSISNALAMIQSDPEVAAACKYAMPRGGKTIEGKSIRLAEIVMSTWGNLRVNSEVVEIGERTVRVAATCHDLESNVAYRAQVDRRITDKNGRRYNDDMIQTTTMAAQSIAVRNAIFRVVPGAITDGMARKAEDYALLDGEALLKRRESCIKHFEGMGIPAERVLDYCKRSRWQELTAEDMLTLRGIVDAVRDGMAALEDYFPAPETPEAPKSTTEQADKLAEKLKGRESAGAIEPPAEKPEWQGGSLRELRAHAISIYEKYTPTTTAWKVACSHAGFEPGNNYREDISKMTAEQINKVLAAL